MKLGDYIRKYREEHGGMSYRAFAALVDLSPQYVANLERGRNNDGKPLSPTMTTYAKIAKGTGVSEVDLLSMLDDVVCVNPTGPDDPYYQITMIGRAMEKTTPERREQMLQLLKIAFPEEFE